MAISRINSRQELKQYALRSLGHPVLRINVDDTQLEDRIDDALDLFWAFHMDGSQRVFLKHTITAQDITDGSIEFPKNVISVLRCANLGEETTTGIATNNIQYQYYMTDVMDLRGIIKGFGNAGMASYSITQSYLNMMENLFSPERVIGFNWLKNRVHFDGGTKFEIGDLVMFECYTITDPDEYNEVWNDRWMKRFVTALFKRQWGENLIKYTNAQTSGGISINGEKIYGDALEEIAKLEEALRNEHQPPIDLFIG